ncbi:hypothetical protein ABTN38_19745, partial [Acinetobacter baumannii]
MAEGYSRQDQRIGISRYLNGPPTRDAIEKIYGPFLTRVAFDEILPSYPSLAWQKKKGKPESDLMDS